HPRAVRRPRLDGLLRPVHGRHRLDPAPLGPAARARPGAQVPGALRPDPPGHGHPGGVGRRRGLLLRQAGHPGRDRGPGQGRVDGRGPPPPGRRGDRRGGGGAGQGAREGVGPAAGPARRPRAAGRPGAAPRPAPRPAAAPGRGRGRAPHQAADHAAGRARVPVAVRAAGPVGVPPRPPLRAPGRRRPGGDRLRAGRVDDGDVRRQLQLARTGLVPPQLPADQRARALPPVLRRRAHRRVPDGRAAGDPRQGRRRAAPAAHRPVPGRAGRGATVLRVGRPPPARPRLERQPALQRVLPRRQRGRAGCLPPDGVDGAGRRPDPRTARRRGLHPGRPRLGRRPAGPVMTAAPGPPRVRPGSRFPLGATPGPGGTNFAVSSGVAEGMLLCLFDDAGGETRVALPEYDAGVWHGFVEGVGVGQAYGYRATGPWDPARGLRCNPAKLLLDPYARATAGSVRFGPEVLGHDVADADRASQLDSAGHVPRSLVVDPAFDWPDSARPHHRYADTVVYEVHVKGFTMRHPGVPPELRGTYAGLGHPAAVAHLVDLGVTAVELLPVHQHVPEAFLLDRGLTNYWGYNPIGFFAPHDGYAAAVRAGRPDGQVAEWQAFVAALHAAGLEVLLDVVFNHTAEGGQLGPTLCHRGLDNPAYYRLDPADPGPYVDTTGCGNAPHPGDPGCL